MVSTTTVPPSERSTVRFAADAADTAGRTQPAASTEDASLDSTGRDGHQPERVLVIMYVSLSAILLVTALEAALGGGASGPGLV